MMDQPATVDTSASVPSHESTAPKALTLWQIVSFSVVRAVVVAFVSVFSVAGLFAFGKFFGTIEWLINYKRRRRFRRAMTRVLGEALSPSKCRRATRSYFIQARVDKLAHMAIDCLSANAARKMLYISGKELLDEALARGQGVYLAMAHQGAHHVVATLLALHGYKTVLVRDGNEGPLRRYIQNRLSKRPEFQHLHVLFADSFPREMYRCLRNGYVLGSALDVNRLRHDKQRHADVMIFGERRVCLTGPLHMAMRCKVPVLQGFIVPEGSRYRFELTGPLLDPQSAPDEDIAVDEGIKAYARNVETFLRQHPSLLTRI